jgi:hypothetical protein
MLSTLQLVATPVAQSLVDVLNVVKNKVATQGRLTRHIVRRQDILKSKKAKK